MCYNNTIRPETREAPNPRARYDEASERQILWHFEAHDDGDDDDDVRDNDDDDDDDGDDDLGESCVFSFARMSKCRLGDTLDVPGATYTAPQRAVSHQRTRPCQQGGRTIA